MHSSVDGDIISCLTILNQAIKCSICLDCCNNPVVTSCAHHFCNFCIEKHIDKKRYANCPLCMKQIYKRELKPASKFKAIVEIIKKATETFEKESKSTFEPNVKPPIGLNLSQELSQRPAQVSVSEVNSSVNSTKKSNRRGGVLMGTSAKLCQNKNNSASEASGDFVQSTQAMSSNISDLNIEPQLDDGFSMTQCTQAMEMKSDSEDTTIGSIDKHQSRRRGGIKTVVYKPPLPPIAPLPIPPFQANEVKRNVSSRKRQNNSSNNIKQESCPKLMKKDLSTKANLNLDENLPRNEAKNTNNNPSSGKNLMQHTCSDNNNNKPIMTVQKSHQIILQTDHLANRKNQEMPPLASTNMKGSALNLFNFKGKKSSSSKNTKDDNEIDGRTSRKSSGWTALRRFRSVEPISRQKSPAGFISKPKVLKKYRISSSKIPNMPEFSPSVSRFQQIKSNLWPSRRRSDSLLITSMNSQCDSFESLNSTSMSHRARSSERKSRKKSASPYLSKQRSSSHAFIKWNSKKRFSSISKKSPSAVISGENNNVKLIDFVNESNSFSNQLPPVPPADTNNTRSRLSRSNTCKFIAPIKTFLSKNRLNKLKRTSLITPSSAGTITPRKRSKDSGSKSPRWSIGSTSKSPAECIHCSGCGETLRILSGGRSSPPIVGRHPDCSLGEDQRSANSVQEMWGTTTSYWQAEDPGDSAENLIISSAGDDVCFVPETTKDILDLENLSMTNKLDSIVPIVPATCQETPSQAYIMMPSINTGDKLDAEALINKKTQLYTENEKQQHPEDSLEGEFQVDGSVEEIKPENSSNHVLIPETLAPEKDDDDCLFNDEEDVENIPETNAQTQPMVNVLETNLDEVDTDKVEDATIPETPDKSKNGDTNADSANQPNKQDQKNNSVISDTLDLLLSQINKENLPPSMSQSTQPMVQRRRIYITSSCLNAEQAADMNEFIKRFNAVKQSSYIPNMTTHVIMAGLIDRPRVVHRTLKFFLAVMDHAWLVNMDWIKDSLKAGHVLDESAYEIQGDAVCGDFHCGPKRSRLFKEERKNKNLRPLFANTAICCLSNIANLPEKEFKTLVTLGGGTYYPNINAIAKSPLIQRFLVVDNSKEFPANLEQICRQNKLVGVTLDWFYNTISTYERIPINESSALFQKTSYHSNRLK